MDEQRIFGISEPTTDLLKTIVGRTKNAVTVKDLAGRYVMLNTAALNILGAEATDVLGRTDADILPPGSAGEIIKNDAEILRTGESRTMEETIVVKGNELVLESTKIVYRGTDDKPAGLITISRDITEHQRAEQALKESEGKYRSLFENANDAIFLVDVKTQEIVDCNEQAAEMEGYSIEELKKMRIKEIHPEDEWPRLPGAFKEISEKGSVTGLSGFHHLRKDGRLIPIEVNARMIELGGRPINFAIIRDLTERVKTREALERSQEFLSATGRMAKVGGWELDIQTSKVSWTDETCRIAEVPFGYSPSLEEAVNFFDPEDRPRLEQVIQRALEYGEPYDIEIRFITAGGRHLWTQAICRPQVVDGRTVKLVGTFQDITERKEAEEALHRKDRDIRKAYVDVFSAVTDEKLLILTPDEIPTALGEPQGDPFLVSSFEQLADSRGWLRETLQTIGISQDLVKGLILASGEAVVNGVKHAGACEVQVCSFGETIQIMISDRGPGINFSDLPKATLLPGFSTRKSLGMGFAVILNTCDRILLSTGPEGTTLVLEVGGTKEQGGLDNILARGLFKDAAA